MKVPYPMTAAMSLDERHAQMFHALQQGLPRLEPVPVDDTKTLSLACYGPSLLDTWQTIQPPILSMSGATKFLAERGIIADHHIDMDPRRHKAKHLEPPIDGVHYLMASVCPPETWTLLRHQRVTLWHTYSGKNEHGFSTYDWVGQHDPGAIVVHGGSTIGLTAFHVGALLGYRHFEVHGMDGSYADASRQSRHAGVHYGHTHKDLITWDAERVTYHTSRIMANAVAETLNTIRNFPMFWVFHGHGLTQALVREANVPNACTVDQAEKAAHVRQSRANVDDVRMWNHGRMSSLWETMLGDPNPQWLTEILTIVRDADTRRVRARYNTGSVGIETALLLRALSAHFKPSVVVEVGTFIGTSTLALHAREHLYTCDRDNDCLPSTPTRTCFPYTTSTDMFKRLTADHVKADLMFFDGRLKPSDVDLVLALSHDKTVYVFDDYVGNQKGMVNVMLLMPRLKRHVLLQPYQAFEGRTTLAALLPLTRP